MKRGLDGWGIDQSAHGHMAVSVVGNVGIEQRPALAAVEIAAALRLPIKQQIIFAPDQTDTVKRDGGHWLECGTGGAPAPGAMAEKRGDKGIFDLIAHRAAQTASPQHVSYLQRPYRHG